MCYQQVVIRLAVFTPQKRMFTLARNLRQLCKGKFPNFINPIIVPRRVMPMTKSIKLNLKPGCNRNMAFPSFGYSNRIGGNKIADK
jgi:hypothetical protein